MIITSNALPSKPKITTFPRLVRDPKDGCVMLALSVSPSRGYYGLIMECGSSMLLVGEIGHFDDDQFTDQYDGSFTITN